MCALSKRSMTLRTAQKPSGQIVSLQLPPAAAPSQAEQRSPSPLRASCQPLHRRAPFFGKPRS